MTMKKIKILIVEDHQIVRTGIKTILSKEDRFQLVGEAADGPEALILAKKHQPDLVLLDIHLPSMMGNEICRDILKLRPECKILVLSVEKDEFFINEMIRAGALGYILKDASITELINAINVLIQGNSYFSKEVSSAIMSQLGKPKSPDAIPLHGNQIKLSKREFEVLKYIAEEMTNKEIAHKLFISPRTVDTHRRNLLQKLKVKNTAGLVKYYLRLSPTQRLARNSS